MIVPYHFPLCIIQGFGIDLTVSIVSISNMEHLNGRCIYVINASSCRKAYG